MSDGGCVYEGKRQRCVSPVCCVDRFFDINLLSGSIPVELQQLTALTSLYVPPLNPGVEIVMCAWFLRKC